MKNHFSKAYKRKREGSSFASCDNSAGGCAAPGGVLLLNLTHHVNPYCMRVLKSGYQENHWKGIIKMQRGWDY